MKIFFAFVTVCVAGISADLPTLKEFAPLAQQFSADVYKELSKTNAGDFMVSPLSLQIILALTSAGAKGVTSNELKQGLRLLENQKETNSIFSQLIPLLRSTSDYNLTTANRIFANEKFEIKDEFKKLASEVFHAGIESRDFKNPTETAKIINDWVATQTNDKIQGIIDPSSIDDLLKLVLINTLYFNGNWSTQFDSYLTRKQKFYVSGQQTKDVDMMKIVDTFNYYACSKLDAQFLELPYIGNEIKMVIALPRQKDGLAALENRIGEVISHKTFNAEEVAVEIPKFSTQTKIEFVPLLQNLGIQRAFTPSADFSGIGDNLAISDVIQKTFINVTESGTEAAAATAVSVAILSLPVPEPLPRITFKADHPFSYSIVHSSAKIVLFTGRIKNFE